MITFKKGIWEIQSMKELYFLPEFSLYFLPEFSTFSDEKTIFTNFFVVYFK